MSSLLWSNNGRSNRRLENLGDLEHLSRVREVVRVIDDFLRAVLVDNCDDEAKSAG